MIFVGQLNQNTMTERDELLIKIAGLLDITEINRASILMDMAESDEAKREIKNIRRRLDHLDRDGSESY